MAILRICQKCGNRLQPRRTGIRNVKQAFSSLRGVCEICRRSAKVCDPEHFGLLILGWPAVFLDR